MIIACTMVRDEEDIIGYTLLHLYDQQQKGLFGRQPDVVLQLSTAIQGQVARVAESRERREKVVGEFAVSRGKPANSTLRELMALKAGDFIEIDRGESLVAKVDGVPVFECTYGTQNSQYAIKVDRILAVRPQDNQLGE